MMSQNFQTHEPLSQVVFIHDYLQFVFQEDILTIYNRAEVQMGGKTIEQGGTGFCDALVALIGRRIVSVSGQAAEPLIVALDNGARFVVRSVAAAARGPEAWQFTSPNRPLLVRQNVQ